MKSLIEKLRSVVRRTRKEVFQTSKSLLCDGNMIALKAGTGSVNAEEIDTVIGEYIYRSALLCTDTATN